MGVRGDMGNRRSIRKRKAGKSGVVYGPTLYEAPLLPFEKELIKTIGLNEEEYRYFVAEARKKGKVRPAGYELIPDIQAGSAIAVEGTLTILGQILVGVTLTAVSMMLQPKPKSPGAIDRRTLDSLTGRNRFTPTTGFESQAELADYGKPIPIIFGRYLDIEETGGILVSPPLVWSRMFSYGSQQGVKLMFVVGEQGYQDSATFDGIALPEVKGIFLGNGNLDTIYDHTFAFYWKRNTTKSGFSRIKATNLAYGTRGTVNSGDPENNDDIFMCPVKTGINEGFCSAHSLSNNAEFGCYQPIFNGTVYKLPWRVVSNPKDSTKRQNSWERLKIAGDENGQSEYESGGGGEWQNKLREFGMSGTGRGYCRGLGITSLNETPVSSNDPGYEERVVSKDDVINFSISGKNIRQDLYGDETDSERVKIDDINSATEEDRLAADEALQLGETFMIGLTTWQVIARPEEPWKPPSENNNEDTDDVNVRLKCIDVPSDESQARIGIVNADVIHVTNKGYFKDLIDKEGTEDDTSAPGAAFYPLMKSSLGIVRNTRPCEVTEIGLRSKVFQRLSGVTNFQTIPQPQELINMDNDEVLITSGTNTSYIKRASVFSVEVRKVGSGSDTWNPLNQLFAVVGNKPVDQYNYIRFVQPEKGIYEYRFVPRNGANLNDISTTERVVVLGTTNVVTGTLYTPDGSFTYTTAGVRKDLLELRTNKEFCNEASSTVSTPGTGKPTRVEVVTRLPDSGVEEAEVTAVTKIDMYSNPLGATIGRMGAFCWQLFGQATATSADTKTSASVRETLTDGRWVRIKYTAGKIALDANHPSDEDFAYNIHTYEVTDSSSGFDYGAEFTVIKDLDSGNPFKDADSVTMTKAGIKFSVAGINATNSIKGRVQAYLYEALGNPASYANSTRTVDINGSANGKNIRLKLTAEANRWDALPNYDDQNPHWSRTEYHWGNHRFEVDQSNTDAGWSVGDTFEITVSDPTNPYWNDSDGGFRFGNRFVIAGNNEATVTSATFNAQRYFEGQSQYSDISFYDGVEKSNDGNPEHTITYVNESLDNPDDDPPSYDKLTTAGLALKASRSFSAIDQIRFWLKEGIPVKRWHPSLTTAYGNSNTNGPSNLLTDLVYYLLTDQVAGIGNSFNPSVYNDSLINTTDLINTSKFLYENKLFFDGALDQAVNIRQFIADTAPNFLCNFVISNGKFSLKPSLPVTSGGKIDTSAVVIKQLFTAGNILEDSFKLSYLDADERKPFKAVVRYREAKKNELPEEKAIIVRWKDTNDTYDRNYDPVESFDLTSYCTSLNHAKLVGKFFLSIRRRVTHTVEFSTVVDDLILGPGDYIKVITESNPYSSAKNGTINASGVITSASTFNAGTYLITYYKTGSEDVQETTMTVLSNGTVEDSALYSSVFTVQDVKNSENVYQVEQLMINEDNTVQITASHFPCNDSLSSQIALDVTGNNYNVEGNF